MVPKLTPLTVRAGNMAVADDENGLHYCLFVKRHKGSWEVLSIQKQKMIMLPDAQFEVLVRIRNFRLVEEP